MLGKHSFNKTLIVVIIIKDTYPSRGWTLVCGIGYLPRASLMNTLDTMSDDDSQETIRILRTFSEQLPKATVPRRLALEYSKGEYLPLLPRTPFNGSQGMSSENSLSRICFPD